MRITLCWSPRAAPLSSLLFSFFLFIIVTFSATITKSALSYIYYQSYFLFLFAPSGFLSFTFSPMCRIYSKLFTQTATAKLHSAHYKEFFLFFFFFTYCLKTIAYLFGLMYLLVSILTVRVPLCLRWTTIWNVLYVFCKKSQRLGLWFQNMGLGFFHCLVVIKKKDQYIQFNTNLEFVPMIVFPVYFCKMNNVVTRVWYFKWIS